MSRPQIQIYPTDTDQGDENDLAEGQRIDEKTYTVDEDKENADPDLAASNPSGTPQSKTTPSEFLSSSEPPSESSPTNHPESSAGSAHHYTG